MGGAWSPHALAVAAALGIGLAGLGVLVSTIDPAPASPLRHLFAVPVIGAALRFGALGGGLAAVGAVLTRAPALFAHLEDTGLSAPALEDLVSNVTLLFGGPLVGALASAARRQRARIDTLIAVQRALVEDAPLPVALARLRALLVARWAGADLALVVRDGDTLTVAGGDGVVAGSAVARVLATGNSLFVPDIGGGPRPHRVFVAPMLARGATIGVLALERTGELGPRDRAALARLAMYLGLALENARLSWRQRRFTVELGEKVAAATRHLEAVDRAKSAFVATVSHELRTPLTALLGFSELLSVRRFPAGEVQRLAGIMRGETERLTRIVDDLLDLSRLEQGLELRIVPVPLAVAAALAAAVEIFRRGVPTHRVHVDCPDGPCRAQVDPDAFDRIVKNLVSNAIKYSPAGSRVMVSARADGAGLAFTVADEGRGIAPDALPHVFDPYYRAPGAAEAARGVGLGLALVKALVEAHGGRIGVASVAGRGTRVTFTLPAAP
ncbi:MAG: sensor histidine kinase [Candidatus Rokuibacteriota bacterium]